MTGKREIQWVQQILTTPNLLAKWVSDQRSNKKEKNLEEDKIKKLKKIGFEWEL